MGHPTRRRPLSSLSAPEASTLLQTLNTAHTRLAPLDLGALDSLPAGLARLQRRLRRLGSASTAEGARSVATKGARTAKTKSARASEKEREHRAPAKHTRGPSAQGVRAPAAAPGEDALARCGIRPARTPVLRSALERPDAAAALVRAARGAGGDKPLSALGLDNLLARIDKTVCTQRNGAARLVTGAVLLRVATMLESAGAEDMATILENATQSSPAESASASATDSSHPHPHPPPTPLKLKRLALAGEGPTSPKMTRWSVQSAPPSAHGSYSAFPPPNPNSKTGYTSPPPSPVWRAMAPHDYLPPSPRARQGHAFSPRSSRHASLDATIRSASAGPQMLVLPDFAIPATPLGPHKAAVRGAADWLLALVPPELARGLRARPALLQRDVPGARCFAVFQTQGRAGEGEKEGEGEGEGLEALLPRAVLALAALAWRQGKSAMRGAVTSGRSWMLLVYAASGSTYRTSPVFSLDRDDERDVLLGLLRAWVEKGDRDVEEGELLW